MHALVGRLLNFISEPLHATLLHAHSLQLVVFGPAGKECWSDMKRIALMVSCAPFTGVSTW